MLQLQIEIPGLADALNNLANALQESKSNGTFRPEQGTTSPITMEVDKPSIEETTIDETTVTHTLEDVRAVLVEKSRKGKAAKVKAILKKHGVDNLTSLDPKNFEAVLKDAKAL